MLLLNAIGVKWGEEKGIVNSGERVWKSQQVAPQPASRFSVSQVPDL